MIRIPVRLAACLAFAALGWAGAILGDGSYQWLTMIFVLWAAVASVMLHNVIPRLHIGGRGKGRFVVADLSQDYFTAFWMWVEKYIRAIRRVRERYAAYLRVYGGGIPYDYDTHARKAVHLALTLSPLVAAPIADVRLFMLALCPIVMIYSGVHKFLYIF